MAALGLRCRAQALSSCSERGLLFLCCGARASHCGGLPCCGAWAPGAQTSVGVARGLWSAGSAAMAHGPSCSAHVGSSQTRARTGVPCIGRQTLNHCATREALNLLAFKHVSFLLLVSGFQPLLLATVRRCWGLLTVDPNTSL